MTRFIGEFIAAARSPIPYVIWLALTLVLAIGGPFRTYGALGMPGRAVYWGIVVALSIVVGKGVRSLVARYAGDRPFLLRIALVAATIALVLAPMICLVTRLMMSADEVPELPELTFFVFIVALSVQLIRRALEYTGPAVAPAPVTDPSPVAANGAAATGPRLLDRVEPHLRGDVLRMSARDHYLEVHTTQGRADLLLRFSDGLAELDGLDGARVHRSHWVSWGAVAAAEREGTRLFLRLSDGERIPVSRSYEHLLAARGLL